MTTEYFTDAPEDYDGFGTKTKEIVGKSRRGPVRIVSTPNENLDWQQTRYASGMYMVADLNTIEFLRKIGDID